ncbi:MAG: hypothetical protein OEZ06_27270 [Myxococcales bacterium]|nr:hypothetical protein [Myxococcales bacterium]
MTAARTLHRPFDPARGGDSHGEIEGLTSVEVDDLLAYVESL